MRSLTAALVLVVGGGAAACPTAPAAAAEPPPPLDACLAAGGWTLAPNDPCGGSRYPPSSGNQFGRITRVTTTSTTWGGELTFTYDAQAPRALGEAVSCGDLGCVGYSVLWRGGGRDKHFEPVAGCGATDETCTVRVWPLNGGTYDVMYAELYYGQTPQDRGAAFAVHVPRRLARLEVDVVDGAGSTVRIPRDQAAYALRAGSSVTASQCVDPFWGTGTQFTASLDTPDCVRLQPAGGRVDGTEGLTGDLPVDSGGWVVVGSPRGDAGAPLVGRPSPYRTASVVQDHLDQRVTLVAERRPTVSVTVEPETC